MTPRRSYGDAVAHSFGLNAAPALRTRSLPHAQIGMTRISCGIERIGMTPQIPPEDTFIAAVYLTDLQRHELWSGGRPRIAQGYAANSMRIVNLVEGYSANILEPHEALSFYMPRAVLDGVTEDAGRPGIADLRCVPGVVDPVIGHLVSALLPAFEQPGQASPFFIDQVAQAIVTHLADHYGGQSQRELKGQLAPQQLRRAKELLASRRDGDLTLAALARECGLSRSYFLQAFRATVGCTPHRWLQRHRVEQAKAMLRDSTATIAEIAILCGFADQSHMTRVFARLTGHSPAAWRRLAGHLPGKAR